MYRQPFGRLCSRQSCLGFLLSSWVPCIMITEYKNTTLPPLIDFTFVLPNSSIYLNLHSTLPLLLILNEPFLPSFMLSRAMIKPSALYDFKTMYLLRNRIGRRLITLVYDIEIYQECNHSAQSLGAYLFIILINSSKLFSVSALFSSFFSYKL